MPVTVAGKRCSMKALARRDVMLRRAKSLVEAWRRGRIYTTVTDSGRIRSKRAKLSLRDAFSAIRF